MGIRFKQTTDGSWVSYHDKKARAGTASTGTAKPDHNATPLVGDMTLAQLKAYAAEKEIDLGGKTKKDEILDAILTALNKSPENTEGTGEGTGEGQ